MDKNSYKINGFIKRSFKKTDCFNDMINSLISLNIGDSPGEGFFWESKYKDTIDLRPNVYDYSDTFIKILVENSIIEELRDITQLDLVLSHIQIRKSSATASYMDWHRDSYYVDGNPVGNIPPTHKLIFYPSFENNVRPVLKMIAGSHNCRWNFQRDSDMLAPGVSQFDAQISQFLPEVQYESSQDEFLLFNTSILHGVIPDDPESNSIRLIYSFVTRDQFIEKYSHKNHHRELQEKFQKMREKNEK